MSIYVQYQWQWPEALAGAGAFGFRAVHPDCAPTEYIQSLGTTQKSLLYISLRDKATFISSKGGNVGEMT